MAAQCLICRFVLVISVMHSSSHGFQVIAQYWSNFRFRVRVCLSNALFLSRLYNLGEYPHKSYIVINYSRFLWATFLLQTVWANFKHFEVSGPRIYRFRWDNEMTVIAVHGHSRSPILVPLERPCTCSMWEMSRCVGQIFAVNRAGASL